MLELKSIGVIRCGIVLAVLYGAGGLFEGLFIVPFMLSLPPTGPELFPAFLKPFLGIGAIVLLPFIFAFGGFVGGIIVAFVYNLVARWTGGLQLTVSPALTGAEISVV